MYRNCVYVNKTKSIHLWTWDSYGNRVKQEIPYKPYVYLEDKRGEDTSIYGTALKKREFETQWDRGKFVKESGIKRLFENLPANQQFLIDNYCHENSEEDFVKNPLKVLFLDIETFSKGKFPDIKDPQDVIQLITCYDTISKAYTTFGLKPFDASKVKDKDIKYIHCKSEEELLKKFIGYWSCDYFDVVSGWNSSGFDIPYIINRISNVLDVEWQKELSPLGRLYEKHKKKVKFGEPESEFVIEGMSSVDYMVMYRKFKLGEQESYSLNYISELELGEAKIEFDGTLWELSINDWQTFVEYNIKDVELLVRLDDKLRYMDILRFLAVMGLTTLDKAIATLPVINGSIAVQARKRDQKIPTFFRPMKAEKNPGAHVQDPIVGFSENMVSFDANSLYPSVMISLNLSPETKLGRFEQVGDMIELHHVSGRTFSLTFEKFAEYINIEKACRTKADFLFSQKTKGIVPEFLDWLYDQRKLMQKAYRACKTKLEDPTLGEDDKKEIKLDSQRYDAIQYAYKIALNSCYGYMGNAYAPMGDDDIASSVTLTGQAVIKNSDNFFKEAMLERFPDLSDKALDDAIRYGDTDSRYISLNCVADKIPLMSGDVINPEFFELCDHIENHINTGMNEWAVKYLKSRDPRFMFKRETICDSAILLKKKYYVLHIVDDEGFKANKFKYRGVSVVKTTMPKDLKPYLKKIIENMISNKSSKEATGLFNEAYETFKTLPLETISRISGINTFDKYVKGCDKFRVAKGMQGHMRAAHYHNVLVDELKLGGKYQKLKTGDKIRYLAVKKPNKYGIDLIGYMSKFPKEFGEIFEINYEVMFEDLMFNNIDYFYKAVGWKLRKPTENVRVELEDFLS